VNLEPRIDLVASALADPTRARILCTLMDGRAYTTKELACAAGVTSQTASFHLQLLADRDFIACRKSGRCSYHRIEDPQVAGAVEALGCLAPLDHIERASRKKRMGPRAPAELLLARSCYDHLAGRLGVLLAERLLSMGAIRERDGSFELTKKGHAFFRDFGIDPAAPLAGRRPLLRPCLDWTERRHHLAGSLASSLFDFLLQEGWLLRKKDSRGLEITPQGLDGFQKHFGLARADVLLES
jgi:DNA-binding transcriptional ArsR family regulator/predicted transcriptional regulator